MKNIFHIILSLGFLGVGNSLLAQAETAAPAATETSSPFHLDTALFVIALTLAFVIAVLSGLLRTAIKAHFHNKMGGGTMKAIAILITLAASNQLLMAQAATSGKKESFLMALSAQSWVLIVIIAVELMVLLFMVRWIKQFTGLNQYALSTQTNRVTWWDKINAFKPLTDEGNIDTGHNYDGIRELDNITPPWFTAAFIGTIIFAGIYLYRYHVAHAAPLMIEEFNISMEQAEKEKMEFLKTQSNLVDENSVTLLPDGQYEEGKTIFKAACAVCHGPEGQGTVGPNLTDDYWIHGGSVKNIFSTIKYGVIDKGMKSWKDDYSANQIAQLTSFIKSMRGTNPSGAKEPQGELYKEEAGAPAPVDTTKKDTAVGKTL